MPDFKNQKELFEYVRAYDINSIPDLYSIFADYEWKEIDIENLLHKIFLQPDKTLVIDSRSEKEFAETSIPNAVNFPVLTTDERHNVGLIYKKHSDKTAVKLAMEYAEPKKERLQNFLKENKAGKKEIIVHCWRGGGRSKFLSKMISDAGFKSIILQGGIKSYRRKVNEFFSLKYFPYDLIEITGMTGSGKTDLLKLLKKEFPVIDLEDAAKHFSSLFGFVPYKIRNVEAVKNQTAFENNLFSQIYGQILKSSPKYFFIESESKKVGDFKIPEILYSKLLDAKCINIVTNIDVRINRIINDYFFPFEDGIKEMLNILVMKARFFRKELSNKIYDFLLLCLKQERVRKFTEIMIIEYYDKKYKNKGKIPIFEVQADDVHSAVDEIRRFMESTN